MEEMHEMEAIDRVSDGVGLRYLPLPHKLLRFEQVFAAVEIMSHEK